MALNLTPGPINDKQGKNDNRMADLMKSVRALGKDAAEGKDALPKLAFAITRAAFDRVIDLEAKHDDGDGKKVDDVVKIYREYQQTESKKLVHEHTKNGVKANASKARNFVKLGMMPNVDGVSILERASVIRKDMADKGEKVLAAYAAYVAVARVQIEHGDADLTDAEIQGACRRAEPKTKELLDVLTTLRDALGDLITGERKDGLRDTHEKTEEAMRALDERLTALIVESERQATLAKAIELGLIPAAA